ncbi:MAG: DoxX family membrane protein [Chitinophagaceae bacterium]|nr:MAG: DoxX family membrane protein [Chitinophagaceae bacterium]
MEKAYLMIRVGIGLNILMHGMVRSGKNKAPFIEAVQKEFADTYLPKRLVRIFAEVLPVLELVTGVFLLLGVFTAQTIFFGFSLMLILLFGKAVKSDWLIVTLQMIYISLYAILIAGIEHNTISIDNLFKSIKI